MGFPSALRDLFAADSQAPAEVPSAIRPAVEIIARLSAERARLRTDLAHLREELKRSDAARGTTGLREQLDAARAELTKTKSERDALAAELERVRAERDALKGERDALKGERDALRSEVASSRVERRQLAAGPSAEQSASLVRLLDRLERAVARFESPASSPTPLRPPPAPTRETPVREVARPVNAPANSFMAALLRDNVNLRAAVEPACQPDAVAPAAKSAPVQRPMPEPEPAPRPMPRGMLGALVAENARLRRKAVAASGSASRNRIDSTTARRRAQSLDRLTA